MSKVRGPIRDVLLVALVAGLYVLIALTGYGQPEDRDRSKGAGFDHHLLKPLEPAALMDLIEKS